MAISSRARARRLVRNLTQSGLARRSGVSLGSLKRFEKTGKISLESLLKIALVLEALDDFNGLFHAQVSPPTSLDELEKITHVRQKGRIS